MKLGRYMAIAAVCCGLLVLFVIVAAQRTMASQESAKSEPKEHEQKLFEQLSPPYGAWLSQDVVWIITPVERSAFLQLSSDEERDQFIEEFWTRRNLNPQSEENVFEEEYYRRILYTNEHFGKAVPGWETDRGRIYITLGPSDEIENSAVWDSCANSPKAGKTATENASSNFPRETWRYRYLEGAGENVQLDFVCSEVHGDYVLTVDSVTAVNALMPQVQSSIESGRRVALENGSRLEVYIKGQQAPAVEFKELEAMATSRIVRDQIKIKYRTDLVRATDFTSMALVTLEIPEAQLNPLERNGKKFAQAKVFGRICNSDDGRAIETFEDIIASERGGKDGKLTTRQVERYEHLVPLRAGIYRLDLVVKDVASGNVGNVSSELVVPWPESGRLETSSLILGHRTNEEFTMKSGSPEVLPGLSDVVTSGGTLDMFWQVYGLKVDERTHGNNASIIYTLKAADGREVWREVQTAEDLEQRGEQLTIERSLPVAFLEVGRYLLQIEIDDHAAGRIGSVEGEFTVRKAQKAVN
jgi:GWxTD domain-containing protein